MARKIVWTESAWNDLEGVANFIARGSSGEVRSMLRVLEGWRTFGDLKSQIPDLRGRSEKISKQLYGWIENLKNSGISGQRHLDEKAKAKYAGKQDREAFLEELRRITESSAEQRKESKEVDDAS